MQFSPKSEDAARWWHRPIRNARHDFTIFKVCRSWRVELANRLEVLGSCSEVGRFRVQIGRLVLPTAKKVGADPTRLKNRSRFGYVMDQLATGRPNLFRPQ